MNTKERPNQNDSGRLTKDDFPRRCDDCERLFLTWQAWNGHHCDAENLIVASDGGEVIDEDRSELHAMVNRTWCPDCERWTGFGAEHADECPHDGDERVDEQREQFDRDELEAALEALDDVEFVEIESWNEPTDFRVSVNTNRDVESVTPIFSAIRTFDLRLWYVDWILSPEFVLVPAAGYQHDYEERDSA